MPEIAPVKCYQVINACNELIGLRKFKVGINKVGFFNPCFSSQGKNHSTVFSAGK